MAEYEGTNRLFQRIEETLAQVEQVNGQFNALNEQLILLIAWFAGFKSKQCLVEPSANPSVDLLRAICTRQDQLTERQQQLTLLLDELRVLRWTSSPL